MKKLTTFLLIIALVCSLSISAFAADDSYMLYNGTKLPNIEDVSDYNSFEYKLIFFNSYSTQNKYKLVLSHEPFVMNGSSAKVATGNVLVYNLALNSTGSWTGVESFANGYSWSPSDKLWPVWSNHSVNGLIDASEPQIIVVECDGSSCPATDTNHDNICDDCGNVLAYGLRSTLLDYALDIIRVSPWADTHTYYAIVEVPNNPDSYAIYISEIMMGTTDGTTVTGGNMYLNFVSTRSDGSYEAAGWRASESWSGTIVEANHTIPNFYPPPLVKVIQGVTAEELKEMTPKLMEDFSTLALCGIGCLALLIILRLFRVSLINFLH